MARIFVSFYNGVKQRAEDLPVFYDAFVHGLKEEGNEVLCQSSFVWTTDFPEIPLDLLTRIKQFDPELIILFNNHFYNYDFSKEFECPIIVYEVDSIAYYANKDILSNKNNKYKYIVSGSHSIKNISDKLKISPQRIKRIPLFTSVQKQNIAPVSNISFIGTFFGLPSFVRDFILKKPTVESRPMEKTS